MSEEHVFETGEPVLVRMNEEGTWAYSLFSHRDTDGFYRTINADMWSLCIPYKNNEHLVGTAEKPNKKAERKEDYTSRQDAWIKETGLQVGSVVLVERKASNHEAGWGNIWNPNMNKRIGTYGLVLDLCYSYGISVGFHGESWNFPYFCLKHVK